MLQRGPSDRQLWKETPGRNSTGTNTRLPDRLSMRDGPYTPTGMDASRGAAETHDWRFDELYAEAKSTLGYGANNLRSVTERYREAYRDTLGRWHRLRDQLEVAERAPQPLSEDGDPDRK